MFKKVITSTCCQFLASNNIDTGFTPEPNITSTTEATTTTEPLTRDPRLTLPPTRGTTKPPRYIGTADDQVFKNTALMPMPFFCHFGDNLFPLDACGFTNVEGEIDDFDWTPYLYDTPTERTGPPLASLEEHSELRILIFVP